MAVRRGLPSPFMARWGVRRGSPSDISTSMPFATADALQVDVARALALRFVHQFIGALNERRREPPRDESPFRHAAQPQADDPDVDANRLRLQPGSSSVQS